MTPRLYAVHFGGEHYRRLARVLEHTARRWCPGWTVDVRQVDPPVGRAASGSQAHVDNHYKLGLWRDAVDETPNGDGLLLLDADTFVTNSLDPLWDLAFDVAYTARDASKFPLNAGVVAVRGGSLARDFFRRWWEKDAEFTRDSAAHQPWRKKYGGINQASLGWTLENWCGFERRLALPCLEWNCEDTCWARFDPATTRVVHVKAALRQTAFGVSWTPRAAALARIWRALDAEASRSIIGVKR